MSVNTISSGTTTASSASAFGGGAKETEDRFLKLLVAQLKNQDPLSPMDNAQVTTQMAQLSTVAGIEDLNEAFGKISSAFNDSEALRATSLIGRSVVVEGRSIAIGEEGSGVGGFSIERPADSVAITIKDAAGNVIREIAMASAPKGKQAFEWDGLDNSGSRVLPGMYRFEVEAKAGGVSVPAVTLERNVVLGVTNTDDGPLLALGGNMQVRPSDVLEYGI